MQEKLSKGLFFGLIGNVLFVAFGLICLIYYCTYDVTSILSNVLEAVAYCTEFLGFGLLAYSDYLLCSSLRFRRLLKMSYSAYILLEAVMMVLELNSYRLEFYKPYSVVLVIMHTIVSGAACFSFLQLDPDNTKFEAIIVTCIGIALCGMIAVLLGVRVYFSIIVNAVCFSALFGSIIFLRSREEIEIDCHGDRANVREFSSTFFSEKEDKKTDKE
jgi:hypothetical protein